MPTGETYRRFYVKFSPKAYATLERLAREQVKTMAEVLRDAIALEDLVAETQKAKGRILIDRQGAITELVPR